MRIALSSAVMLLLGVAAGFVWEARASPAEWEVRADSIVMTEMAARDRFGVIVVFVIIGAVASIVWALAASRVLRDLGWVLTPLIVVTTLIAGVIAWRLGVAIGPEGPQAAGERAVGERIPAKLAIDGIAPFVAWPMFGLIGLLIGTWLRGDADDEYVGEHQTVLAGEAGDDGGRQTY